MRLSVCPGRGGDRELRPVPRGSYTYGALQGLCVIAVFVAGTSVVTPQRMGRPIAVVLSDVAVSAALGVWLGTPVGQAIGRCRSSP
ncbi:hypothetical protein ACTWQF_33645 [Streptomyces sp. 8N114]|uniref:hypothetical protein n=1 Tax=Streptomyces sp. 8N114 TaxID=3457419 RepID=UPI003FCFF0E8